MTFYQFSSESALIGWFTLTSGHVTDLTDYVIVSATSGCSSSPLQVAADPKTAAMPSRISFLKIRVRIGMQMTNKNPMQYFATRKEKLSGK